VVLHYIHKKFGTSQHMHIVPSQTRRREKRRDQCVNGPKSIVNTSFPIHNTSIPHIFFTPITHFVSRRLERHHKETIPYISPLTDTYDYNKHKPHAESHHKEKKQAVSDIHWGRQHLRYAVFIHPTTRINPLPVTWPTRNINQISMFKPTKNQRNSWYCILYIKMIEISSSNMV
jgi:hypothetical protein